MAGAVKEAPNVNTKTETTAVRIQVIDVKPTKSAAEIMSNPPKFPDLRKP